MRHGSAAMVPGERIAAVFFLLLLLSALIHDWMASVLWVFWLLPLGLLWGSALIFAVIFVGVSLRDGEGWARKVRGAVGIPLAMIGVAMLSLSGLARMASASVYLFAHREEMRLAEAKAGPGQPAAIPYLEGIPDGGVAIIRSTVAPHKLPQARQVQLTGERIEVCRPILFDAFACGYD